MQLLYENTREYKGNIKVLLLLQPFLFIIFTSLVVLQKAVKCFTHGEGLKWRTSRTK